MGIQMHLQSQLKGNLVVDLNSMVALDPGHSGVDQVAQVGQTNGVDLKDNLVGTNNNQGDQDGTNSNLIKEAGLDNSSQEIGINLNNNPGNNKVDQQHLVQAGISHSSNNPGS